MATSIENLGEAIEYDQCPAIYIFKNNINGKFYVGETMNLRQRVYSYHKININRSRPILLAIQKYGLVNFSFEYHYYPNHTKNQLLDIEEELIEKYNSLIGENGYNVCSRGCNRYCAKQSLEARKKRSEIFKGRVITEKWRENMSKAKRGENHPMYGKKLSEETRKKMGDSRRGEKNWKHGKITSDDLRNKLMMNRKDRIEVEQYTKSGEFVARYPSVRDAARKTGIDSRYIYPVCDKEGRSAKGFVWKKVISQTK